MSSYVNGLQASIPLGPKSIGITPWSSIQNKLELRILGKCVGGQWHSNTWVAIEEILCYCV